MMKLPTTTQLLIWDLDGTLLDSFRIGEDVYKQLLPAHGLPVPSREVLLKNFHGRLPDMIRAVVGQEVSEAKMAELLEGFFRIDDDYIKDPTDHLWPDALKLAQEAHRRGLRQIVLTNRPHGVRRGNGSPRGIITNSPLAECITQIICGDEVTHHKPDAAVLDGVEYDPATTVVIGDQFVDAQLAHNLRATGIWISREGDPAYLEEMADGWEEHVVVVPSLDDVVFADSAGV